MTKKLLTLVLTALLALTLSACKYENCSTCQSRESGGQIMNNQNVVQQAWDYLDQFDTTK